MSLAAADDCSAPSSPSSASSDDLAALLEAELRSKSSSSGDEEEEEDEEPSERVTKRPRIEELESLGEDAVPLSNAEADEEAVSLSGGGWGSCPPHPGFIRDMCIRCGQVKELDVAAGVAFGYIHKHLRLGHEEIARLRGVDLKKLFSNRKLYLVLDLDHTLLNSTRIIDLSAEEGYLLGQAETSKDNTDRSLFRLDSMHMLTKLRPFVRTFLKEVSVMFELYIYTMGEQSYALEMAKLLDPEGIYFSSRVISQADCTERHKKGLDVVLGAESAVVVLDDTEGVWAKHNDNLILMERYHYFASSLRPFGITRGSLAEAKMDESEPEGILFSILEVLKQAHKMFFDEAGVALSSKDVRQVLKSIRKRILGDCRVAFSRNIMAESHRFWRMAEQLGATCCRDVDPSVTHVIAMDASTEKARWAVKHDKFLVHPRWVEAANFLWKRQPEESYRVQGH
ncbi:RNA polymerase II C-terminal domain phosphatase-like 4 [Acorus calamus]|uniref:RNA polymerase II C-terminal domain phosphatase-like n=1 Tax=Acorus calamus TaxID=4465 RepID=A0AAV9EW73_ACOCL|nr:RNA polymerase II C-terminal domain phosphatase-like 4 [Acorus calamus]